MVSFVSAFPPACSLFPGSRRMSPCQFLCSCALLPSEPVPGVSGFLIIDNISSCPCIQLLYLYSEISQASQVCVPSYIHFFLFANSQLSVFSGQGGRGLWERRATKCTGPYSATRNRRVISTACFSSPVNDAILILCPKELSKLIYFPFLLPVASSSSPLMSRLLYPFH